MNHEELLKRIKQAARDGETELDLSGRGITELPAEIGQLTNLTKLNLSDNQLTELPAEIGQLTNLTTLNLHTNQLTELSTEIGQPTNLAVLLLGHNQLTDLPPEVGRLTELTRIELHRNQFIELPEIISQLTNLQVLSLMGNQLTHLPAWIGQLRQLETLGLGHAGYGELPITTLPPELGRLESLGTLELDGLELVDPPPEIVAQGTKAILAYLRAQLEEERPVWESKLILVGEGGVGKTQLLKALLGDQFETQSETTWGIDIVPLPLAHPEQQDVTMTLNCWDFGGQEIYHATHQFFLTTRSLFVLAWNARLGWEQGKLHYWLDTIQALAPESPVMLVATHIDEREADLPLDDLKAKYPQIVGEWSVSNKDREAGDGIEKLRDEIRNAAAELPLMGQSWPASYWQAAKAIRALEEKHITCGRLEQIMTDSGVSPESHPVLAEQLHQLGDILFFPDDDELRDTVLLDASWVSKKISDVLVYEKIKEGIGVFRREHMEEVWPDLEPTMRDRFLRLMERFDLSYRIPDDPENKSLVVERLSQDPPDYDGKWDAIRGLDGCHEIRMQIDPQSTRPAGIPTWFIARSHRFTTDTHWRYGALFQDKAGRHLGLIEAPPSERVVRMTVRGPNPQNFFSVLREGLELTLDRFPGLKLRRTIPCPMPKRDEPDKPCPHHFDLSHLEERMQLDPPRLEIECPDCFNNVSVSGLLFGLHWTTKDRVLNRLDEIDSNADERHLEVLAEFDDLRELTQRQFLTWFNAQQRLAESHCPRVFSLRPESGSKLLGSKWRLQLYCEAPGCWHPAMEGNHKGLYVVKEPAKWLNTIAPWVQRLMTVFKYAAHFAGPVMGYAAEDLNALVKDDVKLMKALIDKLPDVAPAGDLKASHKIRESDDPSRTGDGASLRSLRQFLLDLDPEPEWGDLRKTLTPEGHWLWLCKEHAAVYRS